MTTSTTSADTSGVTINNMRQANDSSQPGDSGSPIFDGNTAKGIHRGSIYATTKACSQVWEVEQMLGLTVLVAPT